MNSRESAGRSLLRRVTVPWMVVTLVGGMATVLGRGRRNDMSPAQRANLARSLNDPKVRAALEAAQRALEEARRQLSSRDGRKLQEQLSKRTGSALDSTLSTLQPTMKDAGERAREIAERLRVEGQIRSAELGQMLRADVAPKAKTFAEEAISEAEEILADARQRATDLSKTARREYGPEVSNRASALAGLVAAGSSAGYHMLREQAGDIASQRSKKGSRRRSRRAQRRAMSILQTAGHQTKYVATETMMVGVWAGLFGGTIYFALLTNDQRQRVKNFFGNVISQVRDVFSDFQGGDEGFQSSSR